MSKEITLQDVKTEVVRIDAMRGDDEAAHSAEDELHQNVLKAVASGHLSLKKSKELCQEALKTTQIDFARWCA